MGWRDGEWIEGRSCEDAPCCGCCGPARDAADDAYHAERGYYDDDMLNYDYMSDEEEDETAAYWQAEDAALESSLFGDS
jgi:hypothetical protein